MIWEPQKIQSDTVSPSISHEEISSLSHSVVFLYFFALIAEEGFLISPCYSLDLHSEAYVFPFLLCFSLLFFSQLFVRPPQTAILLFCIYYFPLLTEELKNPSPDPSLPSISKPFLYLPLCSQIFLKSVHSATQ